MRKPGDISHHGQHFVIVQRERSSIQAPLKTLIDAIGERILSRIARLVLGVDCGKADE